MRVRTFGGVILLLPLLALPGCRLESTADDPATDASDPSARPDPGAAHVAALATTLERAAELADSVEDLLRPVPLMRPADEEALRRYLNASHVTRARQLGIRVRDAEHINSLVAAGDLVALADSTPHWIVQRASSNSYVVPHMHALLEELGKRFQDRLEQMGIPPYRLEITSTLRTAAQQARLRRGNPNAAAGASSHEFGTTVDLSYAAFAPPHDLPEPLRVDAPEGMGPYLARAAAVTLESVSARKSLELRAILGEVLRQAQADGIVLVIFERLQPVYHITVARPLAG
ncbi:MAG: DUF5715 family protein [Gemmatimonadota bacterium]